MVSVDCVMFPSDPHHRKKVGMGLTVGLMVQSQKRAGVLTDSAVVSTFTVLDGCADRVARTGKASRSKSFT